MTGRTEEASEALFTAVMMSARQGLSGDAAHVRHVYPYLEHAKACMQTGAAEEAIRTLQLIHRLQPGEETARGGRD